MHCFASSTVFYLFFTSKYVVLLTFCWPRREGQWRFKGRPGAHHHTFCSHL